MKKSYYSKKSDVRLNSVSQINESLSFFSKLPNEIKLIIFDFVRNIDRMLICRTCRLWKKLIEEKYFIKSIKPSFEDCIVNEDFYNFRKYLHVRPNLHQQQLIVSKSNSIFTKHFVSLSPKISLPTISQVNYDDLLITYATIGNINVLNYLISKGVKKSAIDNAFSWSMDYNNTSIDYNNTDVAIFLLNHGANIHTDDDNALISATKYNNFSLLKILIGKGADVNARRSDALLIAIEKNKPEIVRLLLENGADVHVDNDLPLHYAVGKLEINKILIEFGANINTKNSIILRYNAQLGHTDVVRLLLEKGADFRAQNYAAFKAAYVNDHTDTVELFINAGADKKVLDYPYQ
jgi:hypothetical protein